MQGLFFRLRLMLENIFRSAPRQTFGNRPASDVPPPSPAAVHYSEFAVCYLRELGYQVTPEEVAAAILKDASANGGWSPMLSELRELQNPEPPEALRLRYIALWTLLQNAPCIRGMR